MRSDPPAHEAIPRSAPESAPESTPRSAPESAPEGDLSIDCDTCMVRGDACGDCIVSVLLGPIGGVSGEERAAFAVLAGSGLVPPLRLVTRDEGVA